MIYKKRMIIRKVCFILVNIYYIDHSVINATITIYRPIYKTMSSKILTNTYLVMLSDYTRL